MLRILEILIEGFILYLLYRFVVHFVIPTYRSIKRVLRQMKEMQEKMNENARQQQKQHSRDQQFSQSDASPHHSSDDEEGEYIDYEEVN